MAGDAGARLALLDGLPAKRTPRTPRSSPWSGSARIGAGPLLVAGVDRGRGLPRRASPVWGWPVGSRGASRPRSTIARTSSRRCWWASGRRSSGSAPACSRRTTSALPSAAPRSWPSRCARRGARGAARELRPPAHAGAHRREHRGRALGRLGDRAAPRPPRPHRPLRDRPSPARRSRARAGSRAARALSLEHVPRDVDTAQRRRRLHEHAAPGHGRAALGRPGADARPRRRERPPPALARQRRCSTSRGSRPIACRSRPPRSTCRCW